MASGRNSTRRGRISRTAATPRSREQPSPRTFHSETLSPYDELLLEASASPATAHEPRPLKRRKVAPDELVNDPQNVANRGQHDQDRDSFGHRSAQVAYDDYSSSSDPSDFDWEEVELDGTDSAPPPSTSNIPTEHSNAITDIIVNLDEQKRTPTKSTRRLPASAIEKRKRLDVHKIHLCCLLVHVSVRNAWCNDKTVQSHLKSVLSDRTTSYLNPDTSWSQFQQSHSFVQGLEQASASFRPSFTICEKGLRRSNWSTEPARSEMHKHDKDSEAPIDIQQFRKLALDLQGSRDVAAQLFCALLRSIGVDTRLVCSLQSLPYTNPAPAPTTNINENKETFQLNHQGHIDTYNEDSDTEPNVHGPDDDSDSMTLEPQPVKRLGISNRTRMDFGKAPPLPTKRRKVIESKYPVYWVEVFNEAVQKWHPVDPFATNTIAKPHKLEPPASDPLNSMSYVVAFESDGTAKDVTRRYARAYNAKTRRARVEATKSGARWWRRVMKLFASQYQADRDQVENAELAAKEASEPIPRNVQDFKDHPYYALERHLRRNEIIHPKKEVGKLCVNKASDAVEPIYRRRDVQLVKSADKWYREGREILTGQQPLKYGAVNRRQRLRSASPASDHNKDDDDNQGRGLYAEFQTQTYMPPSATDSQIPRNAYGNLDIYVNSMIPAGTVHVRAGEAAAAAKMLSIDYADAVTGFKFKGRHGTAITNGAIVAIEHAEAMQEVIRGLRWQTLQEEVAKQSRVVLALWKRFLVALRIRERIAQYDDGTGEIEDKDDPEDAAEEIEDEIQREEEMQQEGGFIPDKNQQELAQPTARSFHTTPSHAPRAAGLSRALAMQSTDTALQRPLDEIVVVIPSPWDTARQSQATNPPQHTDNSIASGIEADSEGGFLRVADNPPHSPATMEAADPNDDLFESASETEQEQGGGFITSLDGTSTADPNTHRQVEQVSGVRPPDDSLASAQGDSTRETATLTGGADVAGQAVESGVQDSSLPDDTGDGNNESDEDSAEQGSLLSHDPDDDETEPQWLADEAGL